jgi:hypothetical protein
MKDHGREWRAKFPWGLRTINAQAARCNIFGQRLPAKHRPEPRWDHAGGKVKPPASMTASLLQAHVQTGEPVFLEPLTSAARNAA